MASEGLTVTATVKQEGVSFKAEVPQFGLSELGETVEDAICNITPKVEEYLKEMFTTKKIVMAELEGIKATATFLITVQNNRSLDEFKQE